ncbi:nitrate reductase molybdenum cofactor assembly chaperone [Thermithiobacillus tepidarius DSM 3134]|uniref:nitrate reductase molybdenum cofactor assembly chaperone n=1 Tax=Thermithiobacillus tepidarius TaxID=929 RepID=UPI000416A829|nr:nitrate reductase molybdenum cofactor assembly chaperone [Thermithiobacillus tepidarius]
MKTFKALALLLTYPEPAWLAALDEVEAVLVEETASNGAAAGSLSALLQHLRGERLIELQQHYVATFDRNPAHSLHLFEHIHGESRERGEAMVSLLQEYRQHGLEIDADELPDYLPLFLEYLSLRPEDEALALLGEAVDVLALIGGRLARDGSPYQGIFRVLEALSPVAAAPLAEQPSRDMEDALVRFGPGADGVEPLLTPKPQVAYVDPPRPGSRAPTGIGQA